MRAAWFTWTHLLAVASVVAFAALAVVASAGHVDSVDQDLRRTAVVITQVAKAIVARPDPQGHVGSFSGSFPSGHMVILLTCLGGVLLLWRERPPAWAWWVAVVAELTMGLSLLLLSMHWFTDVIGGLLLAVPLLVVAASPRFLTPVHRTAPHSVGSLS